MRKLRWKSHIDRIEEEDRSDFIILTSKPTGKRPLGRSRHRWIYLNYFTLFKIVISV